MYTLESKTLRKIRQRNISDLYKNLNTYIESTVSLEEVITDFHKILLTDISTEINNEEYETKKRMVGFDVSVNSPGKYRSDPKEGYTGFHFGDFQYVAPISSDLPKLMKLLSDKYLEMLKDTDKHGSVCYLGAWTMLNLILLHPFKDGQGRVARAIYPYTLLKKEQVATFPETWNGRHPNTKNSKEFDFIMIKRIGLLFDITSIYKQQMKEGGIILALAYEATREKTESSTLEYYNKLKRSFQIHISNTDLKSLKNDEDIVNAASILQKCSENPPHKQKIERFFLFRKP